MKNFSHCHQIVTFGIFFGFAKEKDLNSYELKPFCFSCSERASPSGRFAPHRALHFSSHRIYRGLGLKVLKRGGRKRAIGDRKIERLITKANQCWALGFVHDSLANGRKLRLLTVIDTYTRESLKIVNVHLWA